ncbi:MAG TPA: acyl-CoA dehydrogenase family protein [Ramlibacter sp.]|nr:acyl-CoA dehydrogenase family protein [Ramlibacter sp.]
MLDERWSEDVEEIASALRKMLEVESSPQRVRAAEEGAQGRDEGLEARLRDFGLEELRGDADLFARVAYELGRSLASTTTVETLAVLALTGQAGVALAFDGPVPGGARKVAVRRADGVYVEALRGQPRRTAAGDALVTHEPGSGGDRLGDLVLADRLQRFASLTEAARLVGAGQALLRYGVGYVNERKQFGKLIGAYQGVAHRMARVAGDLDAAELLVRKAAFSALPQAGGDGAPAPAFARMVRAKAIEAARSAATNVHQVFGGNGFAMEYDVQLYSRRIRSWALRCPRGGQDLVELARLVLDPARRDALRLMWHYDQGMPLPRWAAESDRPAA